MDKKHLEYLFEPNSSVNIQMPNEIFDDLKDIEFKTYQHRCFAYSYYYVITYLYRNALYGNINTDDYSTEKLSKLFVGNHKHLYPVTKKGGILDQIEYTESTTDYPTSYYMNNDIICFSTIKELRKSIPDLDVTHSPNLTIKKPIKAFYRHKEDVEITGTYYYYDNTHLIPIDVFMDIVLKTKRPAVSLFIYGYLKMMNDKFKNGFQVSNKGLSEVMGCEEKTVSQFTIELEKLEFISSTRKIYEYKMLEKIYTVK